MKNKFYLFLLMVMLLFISCSNESVKEESTPTSQSTSTAQSRTQLIATKHPKKKYHLEFKSLEGKRTILEIKDNIYDFSNIIQPIVLVNFFATWCPPCRGQIPHLNNLQKKYEKNLFMMGILVHDDFKSKEVRGCVSLKKVDYYISDDEKSNQKFATILAPQLGLKSNFELPMMVMFVYGAYYTHYEGSVPEEMIESDIKQALNEIEG